MRDKAVLICRLLLAGVFILSAFSKIISTGIFEIVLVDQGIADSRSAVAHPARFLTGFELALGVLLLVPHYLKRVTLPVTFLVLLVFSVYLQILIFGGSGDEDCGCFGELLDLPAWPSFIKNVVLMGMTVFVFRYTADKRKKAYLPPLIVVGAVGAVFLMSPVRSLEDNLFARFTNIEQLGRTDLTDGEYVVGVFSATCEDCQMVAGWYEEFAGANSNVPETVFLIWADDQSELDEFFRESGADFPFRAIDIDAFFELIGDAPPRFYWIENGEQKAVWDIDFRENWSAAFGGSK